METVYSKVDRIANDIVFNLLMHLTIFHSFMGIQIGQGVAYLFYLNLKKKNNKNNYNHNISKNMFYEMYARGPGLSISKMLFEFEQKKKENTARCSSRLMLCSFTLATYAHAFVQYNRIDCLIFRTLNLIFDFQRSKEHEKKKKR